MAPQGLIRPRERGSTRRRCLGTAGFPIRRAAGRIARSNNRSYDDKWIAEANLYHGKKLVRRGRPAGSGQKTQTALRISKDVLEFFRTTGPEWQTRMDNALKRYVAAQRQ